MFDARAALSDLGVSLAGVSADSRRLRQGEGFLAYAGDADDGRRHIPAAMRAGAGAVLWEAQGFAWPPAWDLPNRAVADLRDNAGAIADVVYGAPSARLPVVAVTGTNGKSTITHYAAQLFDGGGGGGRAGVIGTLGAGALGAPGALTPLENTTPDAPLLHALLRRFADDGFGAAFVEASSHGIAQGRLRGARLAGAVFANAGRDHLDYHGDAESYWRSKAALFDAPDLPAAVLNADDDYCAALAARLRGKMRVLTYGENGDALRLIKVESADGGEMAVTLDGDFGRHECRLRAAGRHNAWNFAAAVLAAHAAGADMAGLARRAPRLTLPAGRLQKVGDTPAVYVDYAHTPDAFAAVLPAMKPARGRLLAVFGCGGGRDRGKRAAMGRLAAEFADVVFITDDNPRDEDAAAIRAAIARHAAGARNIAGRAAAIAAAIGEARAADTVLILGKGHEERQITGGDAAPFSDAAAARACIGAKASCA